MNADVPAERVAAVREFNRMYTRVIGVLDESLLNSPYSLTEVRVLFELSLPGTTEVPTLRRALGLDAGYLSRLLTKFEAGGLIVRTRSDRDARTQVVALTPVGRDVFARLDARSNSQVGELLDGLAEDDQDQLVRAMGTIRTRLDRTPRPDTVVLRPPRPGDYGWVVYRHGALYGREYGFDATFEGLTAQVIADYLADTDPRAQAAWIAEVQGEPAGSVFCVRQDEITAKLRLLLVEPAARGNGVGSRLVDECLAFARAAGYRAMELFTVDVLAAARHIYQRAGFRIVKEEPQRLWGRDLTGETWRLNL
ncbi:MAG TPA: helix-turn-helix domain-containing GNAT family N-acetyltransferase [Actinophytocola sp.]|uniref:bifunctional helix-turn-helix transcriptional regulator/GNAT family N-acetyltransferase n=1 Tax=Actinophytocola sp. TaxID=1872138 RepID=UPI002DB83A5F|nr:helix-turn-helix domain-containing GNAT family N-acetyltransferase [Actinophytocola sp.]HEU5473050.1 helix-turn-helix domain-containing GNAT family N-acetyltransferase [Actinophytocola sp.]